MIVSTLSLIVCLFSKVYALARLAAMSQTKEAETRVLLGARQGMSPRDRATRRVS